jgi:hypothetical protein
MNGNKQIGEYTLLNEIGRGNFSVVYLGEKKENNEIKKYAVKCINKNVY